MNDQSSHPKEEGQPLKDTLNTTTAISNEHTHTVHKKSALSRRAFLGNTAGATVAGLLSNAVSASTPFISSTVAAASLTDIDYAARAAKAYEIRLQAAQFERGFIPPGHPDNGDEERYPNKIGNFSKGLPHNSLGEVDLNAYQALLQAVTTGSPADFEAIPLGGPRKLVNPQAALAFELEGPDSHSLVAPPAPAFASAEMAAETAELYWQALARDIAFADYDAHPLTNQAAEDLSRYAAFRGPKVGQALFRNSSAGLHVGTRTLFGADLPGVLNGPVISQFLLKDIPFGVYTIPQQFRPATPGVDYLTNYADWLANQNGANPGPQQLEATRRYARNGRDLARWVQTDVLYQAYLDATLILLGLRAPFDANNPYNASRNQQGGATLGNQHIQSLIPAAATRVLKAIWFQKWRVHRRLRPEAFGGRIHNHRTGAANYPLHSEIVNSPVLDEVYKKYGTYLLPQAFVEGSPLHPSYLAGHAGLAGGLVTVLKAFFEESFVLPDPALPSADGLSLIPYTGGPLTVGGELNKLGWNIAMGRMFAGIHYRSDQVESMKLGEEVAIRFLKEEKMTLNEEFIGWSLTKFDGSRILI